MKPLDFLVFIIVGYVCIIITFDTIKAFYFLKNKLKPKVLEVSTSAYSQRIWSPYSQPLVINIENTTNTIVNDLEIFNSNKFLYGSEDIQYDSQQNLIHRGVKISNNIPGTTYRELLSGLIANPMNVSLIHISSATVGQFKKNMKLVEKDNNGNTTIYPLSMGIDPYQFQGNMCQIPREFTLGSHTSLIFNEVLPYSLITLFIYPPAPKSIPEDTEKKPCFIKKQFQKLVSFFKRKK